MNRERAKELLPIIIAFANGEDIEFLSCGEWLSVTGPEWNKVEYRIKPKPREWEVLVDELKYILTVRQDGEGERNWIKVREVIE